MPRVFEYIGIYLLGFPTIEKVTIIHKSARFILGIMAQYLFVRFVR